MKQRTIYALGFFDGVHLGHQALLAACRRMAERLGCRCGVVTFLGHPDTLVSGVTPPLINTPQDRKALLERYGMDTVVELTFDETLMRLPWQDFFKLLVERYGAAGLVCGEDFRFGNRGEGNAEKLKTACQEQGILCEVVPQQKLEGVPVSSTCIRSLLEQGDVERANAFLAHPHSLTGTVVAGKQLGRTIGIPTANLRLPEGVVVPKFGVYICRATVEGKSYAAVTNVGVRPTVSGRGVTVEPWLLDFEGDLYGKPLMLEFFKYLRGERKFPSLTELQEEIQKNALETRKYFEFSLYNRENL